MPLYEYECKSCGSRFEKIQKFSDPLVTACPKCGEETVEQMISAPAFQFKGSGWYVSDYGNKKAGADKKEKDGDKPTASADSKDSSQERSNDGGKAAAKSDAQAESKSSGEPVAAAPAANPTSE